MVQGVAPTIDERVLPLDVDDAGLGVEIVNALLSFRRWATWEEAGPQPHVYAEAHPDVGRFDLCHHVGVEVSGDVIELNAKAAKIKRRIRTQIPSSSSNEQIGAAVRSLLTELGPLPESL
jgi:hypothetical protein